jgi:hypothetical protein
MAAMNATVEAGYDPLLHSAMCVRNVRGGEESGFMASIARVGDEQFRESLTLTLRQSGLITADGACKYKVDANLLGMSDIRMPDGINSLKTVSNVNYKVYNGNEPIFLQTITAAATADAFSGNTRATEAHERSIQANLSEFMKALSRVKLAPR